MVSLLCDVVYCELRQSVGGKRPRQDCKETMSPLWCVAFVYVIGYLYNWCVCVCVCVFSNDELTKRFDELDKDRNGVLSENEVVSVIGEMMGVDRARALALMQMFDRNQDGNLDKTEFMQMWASMFGR